jgi:hypothetical protein
VTHFVVLGHNWAVALRSASVLHSLASVSRSSAQVSWRWTSEDSLEAHQYLRLRNDQQIMLIIIYPTCIDPSRQTQQFVKNILANPSKITQSVLKEFLCVEMKSPTLLIILGWVFL